MVNREISNFVESRLKSGSSRGRAVAFQSISFSIIYDTSKWYLLPFVSPSTCTVLLLGCCRANYNSFHLICQMTGQHSVWVCIYCSINRWAVFLREKHPLQLLHTKKGVGLFLTVGLFSGDYGMYTCNDPWTLFLQALGYFYKLGSIAALNPPLVMVITEEWANIIIFPFRRDQDLSLGKLCRVRKDAAVQRGEWNKSRAAGFCVIIYSTKCICTRTNHLPELRWNAGFQRKSTMWNSDYWWADKCTENREQTPPKENQGPESQSNLHQGQRQVAIDEEISIPSSSESSQDEAAQGGGASTSDVVWMKVKQITSLLWL